MTVYHFSPFLHIYHSVPIIFDLLQKEKKKGKKRKINPVTSKLRYTLKLWKVNKIRFQ